MSDSDTAYVDDSATGESSDYTSEITSEGTNDDRPDERLQMEFFNHIKACNVTSVRDLLDKHGEFDVNCKNYQGMTGLNMAIEVNCEQTVDLLLSRGDVDIGDSLMHAIRENQYSIVIKLLDILQSVSPETVQLGYGNSTEFPQYLTPLMLAAQCGHFKIVNLLLKRGHAIATPHKPQCLCKEICKSLAQLNNGLGASELKLSVFRALANPSYISLTSEDPILTAFQLSKTLRDHGNVDRIFKSDYELLDLQTRMFAVHLIGLCRSSGEVELILARRDGCNFFGAFQYHRLVMAMDLKQKEFVSHAYVQQTLEVAWTGKWHEWRRYGSVYKSAVIFPRVLLLPWISFLYLFLPYTKQGQHYALPVNRMLNYLSSYAAFLAILTYENNWNKTEPPVFTVKIVICLYVAAYAVRAIKLVMVQGPRRYFSTLWNVYDCAKLGILVAAFACWWIAYLNSLDDAGAAAAPTERKYWRSSDIRLVAEGLLAVATVMAYLRLLFLCQLSYALGPMQVSLGKMTTDFARFAILFGIIILAFTAGLCRYYQYYEGMTKTDPLTGYEFTQDDSFVNVYATLKTLFWAIFCMTSSTAGSVVIETALTTTDDGAVAGGDGDGEMPAAANHYFTQAVGTLLFSVFETLSVIVMLNMLIATMTNTFIRVTGNSYIEWVFGRTQVFLSFSVHTELPPPLNLLPSIECCRELCGCVGNCCRASAIGVANMISPPKGGNKSKQHSAEDFKILMTKLVRRYFRDRLSNGYVRKCNPTCC